MLHDNIGISGGRLTFAGRDTVELARRYGTPLYLLDEKKMRDNCRCLTGAIKEFFPDGSRVLFASKALAVKETYRVVREEGLGADVVSCGEICTALAAGTDPADLYFHGNCKPDGDIRYAIENGVGHFVVDGPEELLALDRIAGELGKKQKILLRLNPDIDPHTFAAVATGQVDSKFGVALGKDADAIIKIALGCPNVILDGLHCHLGSQMFEADPFIDCADAMLGYIAGAKDRLGLDCRLLDIGGGIGVRYVESDPDVSPRGTLRALGDQICGKCASLGIAPPAILIEPGRCVVAAAGMTLYCVGAVKKIPGVRNYVSVDGGMGDNPRYCLYRAEHTVYNASRADLPAEFECTVAGRCCESGDMIGEGLYVAEPERGDIIAVAVTGAYNYSMASNYNRLPRPAMLLLGEDGEDRLIVKRESYEDLVRNDI